MTAPSTQRGRRPGAARDRVAEVVESQIRFYQAAGELEERRGATARPGQDGVPSLEPETVSALEAFRPRGVVLELACGSGRWTAELLRYADRLTAVDVAPSLIAVAQRMVPDDVRVTLLARDIFHWRPPGRFDVVFFAYWLCHVPASRFVGFWSWVADALKPTGRVFFVEARKSDIESGSPYLVSGVGTVTDRQLRDGQAFHLIENRYTPEDLQARLLRMGWQGSVRAAGTYSLVGRAQLSRNGTRALFDGT
jgi:demethylmenaquinone methyltransferase/2-methoxy-6-polyprenyl-1,4-benzoquinol methylase